MVNQLYDCAKNHELPLHPHEQTKPHTQSPCKGPKVLIHVLMHYRLCTLYVCFGMWRHYWSVTVLLQLPWEPRKAREGIELPNERLRYTSMLLPWYAGMYTGRYMYAVLATNGSHVPCNCPHTRCRTCE